MNISDDVKKIVLLMTLLFALLLFSLYNVAASQTTNVAPTLAKNYSGNISAVGGNRTAGGGNFTQLNLTAALGSSRYHGLYGNVTASLQFRQAGTGRSFLVQSITIAAIETVFASTNRTFNFDAINSTNVNDLASLDTAFNFSATDGDSITNVFDDTASNVSSGFVGRTKARVPITKVAHTRAYNRTGGSLISSITPRWKTGIFKNGNALAKTRVGAYAFAVDLNVTALSGTSTPIRDFTNNSMSNRTDYELLLPVHQVGGSAAQLTYFLFVAVR